MTTQTAPAPEARWTKLNNGKWGVRVPGRASVGQSVTVARKDGSRSAETVSAVLWTGIARDGSEASLVTIIDRRSQSSSGSPARSSYVRGLWTGCSCGSREDSAGQLIPARRNCESCEHDA
jgi:hypothetical protein